MENRESQFCQPIRRPLVKSQLKLCPLRDLSGRGVRLVSVEKGSGQADRVVGTGQVRTNDICSFQAKTRVRTAAFKVFVLNCLTRSYLLLSVLGLKMLTTKKKKYDRKNQPTLGKRFSQSSAVHQHFYSSR